MRYGTQYTNGALRAVLGWCVEVVGFGHVELHDSIQVHQQCGGARGARGVWCGLCPRVTLTLLPRQVGLASNTKGMPVRVSDRMKCGQICQNQTGRVRWLKGLWKSLIGRHD